MQLDATYEGNFSSSYFYVIL